MLYSILLELRVQQKVLLPRTTGRQIHAMFLHFMTRDDPVLFAQLHDAPGSRPFTLSQLLGAKVQGDQLELVPGQAYYIRVTLFDGGNLWDRLCTLFLEVGSIEMQLGRASLTLTRLLANPRTDSTGWVARISWQELANAPLRRMIPFSFVSPTAFNINGQYFALFPEPLFVWDSLIRVWNTYAPELLRLEKQALRSFIQQNVAVIGCDYLATHTLHYQKHTQKGFTGVCRYQIGGDAFFAQQLTILAAFAHYAGVGYKTTWGMGQARFLNDEMETSKRDHLREAQVCTSFAEPLASRAMNCERKMDGDKDKKESPKGILFRASRSELFERHCKWH